jgi:hypothetical protein
VDCLCDRERHHFAFFLPPAMLLLLFTSAFCSDLGTCCGPCGTNEKGWIHIDGSLHFTVLRDLLSLFRCIHSCATVLRSYLMQSTHIHIHLDRLPIPTGKWWSKLELLDVGIAGKHNSPNNFQLMLPFNTYNRPQRPTPGTGIAYHSSVRCMASAPSTSHE